VIGGEASGLNVDCAAVTDPKALFSVLGQLEGGEERPGYGGVRQEGTMCQSLANGHQH
jgi:hypothetical protein